MIGAITNLDALRRWFYDNGKPCFTLRYDSGTGNGNTDRMIYKNVVIEDMDAAWDRLQNHVADQANVGRARLALIVYDKGKENNPISTYIDIRPGYQSEQHGASAISGLPPGIGSINEFIEERVALAMLKKENEDLKEQLNQPQNNWERSIETLSGVPGISEVLKIAVAGIVAKFAPQSMPVVAGILNGTSDAMATGEGDHDDGVAGDPQTRFTNNIQSTASLLNVDPLTLSERLNALVKQNPEVAKQLLQT